MKKSLTTLVLVSAVLFSANGYTQNVPPKGTCDERCKETAGKESLCPHCKTKGCKACCKEGCSEKSCKHSDASKGHKGHTSP